MFSVIVTSTPQQRLAWLAEAKELCQSVFQKASFKQDLDSDKKWPSLYALDAGTLIRNGEKKDWAAVHALNVAAFETSAEAKQVDILLYKENQEPTCIDTIKKELLDTMKLRSLSKEP
jgi:hypothetical protein